MGLKVYVLPGEKFTLTYSFRGRFQQAVIVKDANGDNVFDKFSVLHPREGIWEYGPHGGPIGTYFTIEAFHKNERRHVPASKFFWPNYETEVKRVNGAPNTILITIGTEDYIDNNFEDTVLYFKWEKTTRSINDNTLYDFFRSDPY
ncbi:MAG TPA: hypothetical protein VD794_13130 [Flavisolibacter sp.]|nr:hypothetical protein [Flavisolibacter sp.]